MAVFSDVQSNIADYLNRTDLTNQIKTAINRAIASYSTHDFWFTQATGTFVTVASQESYGTSDGIPSDLREITYMKLTSGNSFFPIKMRNIQFIQDNNPTTTSIGQPTYFAFWANKIYFTTIPDAVYTITLFYRKNYTALVNAGDSNDFTTVTEALDLIEAKALWWLNTYIIRDPVGAEENLEMESSALAKLDTISNNIQSSERNQSTDF